MLDLFISTVYAADDISCTICDKIIANIYNPIVGVLFGVAFIVFLYGVLEFIQGGSNEKAVEIGKRHILYGILGLVIIVGVNGIIALIRSTVLTIGG